MVFWGYRHLKSIKFSMQMTNIYSLNNEKEKRQNEDIVGLKSRSEEYVKSGASLLKKARLR